jgi:hypothetical protein
VEQIDMYGTALQAIHLVLVLVGLLIIQERWALGVIERPGGTRRAGGIEAADGRPGRPDPDR